MQANSKIVVTNQRRGNTWKYTVLGANGRSMVTSGKYTRRDNCLRGVRRLLTGFGNPSCSVSVTDAVTGKVQELTL